MQKSIHGTFSAPFNKLPCKATISISFTPKIVESTQAKTSYCQTLFSYLPNNGRSD